MADESEVTSAATAAQSIDDLIPDIDTKIREALGEGDRQEVQEEAGGQDSAPVEEASQNGEAASKPKLNESEAREYQRALQNLKLAAKAPDAVLESMSPLEIIAWWSGLAEKKAADDRTYRERAELQKQLDELQRNRGAEREQTASQDVEKHLSTLKEDLGEGTVEALIGLFEGRLAGRLGGFESALEGLYLEQVRSGLGDQASDPETWEKIRARTSELWSTSMHDDLTGSARLSALAKIAARIEAPELPTREQESDKLEASLRAKGSPTTRTSVPRGDAPPKDADEALDRALGVMAKSDKYVGRPNELRKAIGLPPL